MRRRRETVPRRAERITVEIRQEHTRGANTYHIRRRDGLVNRGKYYQAHSHKRHPSTKQERQRTHRGNYSLYARS